MWWFVRISGLQCLIKETWIIIVGPPLEIIQRVWRYIPTKRLGQSRRFVGGIPVRHFSDTDSAAEFFKYSWYNGTVVDWYTGTVVHWYTCTNAYTGTNAVPWLLYIINGTNILPLGNRIKYRCLDNTLTAQNYGNMTVTINK